MIRFCDGAVFSIDVKDYTRTSLLLAILENKLQNVLFMVNDDAELLGTIQYKDILGKECVLKDCIVTEKIYFDENVFENCHKFIQKRKDVGYEWLPVYNENDEVIYFAYEEPRAVGLYIPRLDYIRRINEIEGGAFIGDLYPDTQAVYLDGLNELSYSIYKYLKKIEFPYKLIGDKWKLLGTEQYKIEMNKECEVPDYARFYIRGENLRQIPQEITDITFFEKDNLLREYDFMNRLLYLTYNKMVRESTEFLNEHGIYSLVVRLPAEDEISSLSDIEDQCRRRSIAIDGVDTLYRSDDIELAHKVYGKELWEARKSGKTMENRKLSVENGTTVYSSHCENRQNRICLVAPCTAIQSGLMPEDTFVEIFQKYLDEDRYDYRVESYSVLLENGIDIENIIKSKHWKTGDIVIFMECYLEPVENAGYLDLAKLFNSRGAELWFGNEPRHLTTLGSRRVAEYIWKENLLQHVHNTGHSQEVYPVRLTYEKKSLMDDYVKSVEGMIKSGSNGAIVMNCNPYTRGHDYLINEARKQVDWLYVFVVEEDKSFFPFTDRYNLVKANTSNYDNVIVIPSGRLILSADTLPTYFIKELHQEAKVDASQDLELFGLGIAPAFNIKTRFVGEEPIDKVTNQYNGAMKEILPQYGINLVEIPRMSNDDGIISASKVRKELEKKNWDLIRKMVPKVTYEYLYEKYNTEVPD